MRKRRGIPTAEEERRLCALAGSSSPCLGAWHPRGVPAPLLRSLGVGRAKTDGDTAVDLDGDASNFTAFL